MNPRLQTRAAIAATSLIAATLTIGLRKPACGAEAPGVLRFRRIYAAADRYKDWPGFDKKHIPVDPAEFERLLKAANVPSRMVRAAAARTVAAEYRARLAGDQLTAGQAVLRVVQTTETSGMLILEPCNLAIGKASWFNLAQTNQPKAVAIGLGADGVLAARVERSGRLEFTWSLSGNRDAAEAVHFSFELPPSPANRLLLDLPDQTAPVLDCGVVFEAGGGEKGFRRWQIELGGHQRFRLRVVPAGDAAKQPRLPMARQSVAYEFSLRGLEAVAQLKVEVQDEPLQQIAFALDGGLQPVAAQYGDLPVPWAVTSAAEDKVTRIVLTLPEPIKNTGRMLRLRALAPLVTDEPWRLPRIRPEGVFWQEGSATLLIPAPLVLRQLTPDGCWQSGIRPLSGSRSGESVQLQHFSPDATAEVVLARRREPVQLLSGTAIELGGDETTAEVRADFRVSDAPRFSLTADVAQQWLIDSVLPVEAVDDWSVERRGGHQVLTVYLAKALAPNRPVRLHVVARRLHSPLGRELTVNQLVPLRFHVGEGPKDTDRARRLVAVRAKAPYQLVTAGAEGLNRIDRRSLDAAELELFAQPPHGMLFQYDSNAAGLRIGLEAQKPSYSATIRAEACVEGHRLRESYVLRCEPESVRVERVVVHFSHRRDAPPAWTLGTENSRQIAARQWSAEEQASAEIRPGGETWELLLRRPRSVPFEIRATRERLLDKSTPVSLASLPEAAGQRATLVIRSSSPTDLRIENRRLKPVPPAPVPPGRRQTALATYRYDPAAEMRSDEAAVLLSPLSARIGAAAWIWQCYLESRYQSDGAGQHLCAYRLQNCGVEQFQLKLPAGVAIDGVHAVWVDAQPASWRQVAGDGDRRLVIDLPGDRKSPVVSVNFSTHGERLGRVGSLQSPFPDTDLDTLARLWTVRLPPPYEAYGPDRHWQSVWIQRPSIRQRLFGPLGRAADRRPFDPLAAKSWVAAVADQAARRKAARKAGQLVQVLGALAAEEAEEGNGGKMDWATLLTNRAIGTLQVELLIDRQAVARLGLAPKTPIRGGTGQNPTSGGIGLLQKANLAVLVGRDVMVLTSQADAALYHAWLSPLQHPTAWWILPGPLDEQVRQAVAGDSSGAIIPVKTWKSNPAEPQSPRHYAALAGLEGTDLYGWTEYRLETSSKTPLRLRYVHRPIMQFLGSVTFLLVVASTWWQTGRGLVLLTILLGVFGLAAILLPDAYSPITSGVVLGVLFCLAVWLIRRPRIASGVDPSQATHPAGARAIIGPLGIILITLPAACLLCAEAAGQQPAAKPAADVSPVFQVFIPIDEGQQPTGGKVYLPQEFYDELHRRASEASGRPQGWLITSATYRGALSRQAGSERLGVAELKVSFELQVFEPGARVRIPLRRDDANLPRDGALLDGREVQPEWEASTGALAVEVPQQGRHRLELLLRPAMLQPAGPEGFDLAIPPLATSILELMLPPGGPEVSVPSAHGPVYVKDDPLRLVAVVGPADRLSVRWPRASGSGGATTVDLEELLWLKIRPGSVVIDAKFKFKILEGQVRQLRLSADPRLRLLPLAGDNAPQVRLGSAPDQLQTITFEWPKGVSGEVVVDAGFLMTGTSGIGNLRLPRLEPLDARPTRRWMALSVDPRLEYETPTIDHIEAVSVPDFLRNWGEAETEPLLAFRPVGGEAAWSIATRPRQPRTTVVQTLLLSVDRRSTAVRFDAELTTTAGYNFQYRIQAPNTLQVEDVSLLEDGVQHAVRFSQDKRGGVTVFLDGPVAGRQKLSLRGRLPTQMQRKTPLTVFKIDQAELLASRVELFRRPSVLVAVSRVNGPEESNQPAARTNDPALGRLVRVFHAQGKKPLKATLMISPNRPEVTARQITRLRCDASTWRAEVYYRIEVTGGVVDEFYIDAPSPFNGPYRISGLPPATFRVVEQPGRTRQLIVRPREAIAGQYRFSLSGLLDVSPSERPSLPQLFLRRAGKLKQTILLPTRAQGQPVTWETGGLEETELPDELLAPQESGLVSAFEVVGETYRAVVMPADTAAETASVRLADIQLAWHPDGACRGVATFDVEPVRASEVPLTLPLDYRLLHVTVAGVPIRPEPAGAGAWRVPLGAERLPQRIEVLFTGAVAHPTRSGRHRFFAPALGALPVENTLWTVAGPSQFKPGLPENLETITPWRQELARLKNVAARIRYASMIAGQDPDETTQWCRPWAERLVRLRTLLDRQLVQGDPTAQARAVRLELAALDRQQSQIAARLGTTAMIGQLRAGPAPADDLAELWKHSTDRRRAVTRCAVAGAAPSIALDYRRAESGSGEHRLTAAIGWLLLICLAIFAVRQGLLAEWFKRWPALLGVIVGLSWWLWLWPSILGLGIVLASLTALILSGWKPTTAHSESSIIALRSSQS